jgi:hypothetical protein
LCSDVSDVDVDDEELTTHGVDGLCTCGWRNDYSINDEHQAAVADWCADSGFNAAGRAGDSCRQSCRLVVDPSYGQGDYGDTDDCADE